MLMRQRNFPTLSDRTSSPTRFSDWMDEFFEEAFNQTSGSFVPGLNVYETDEAFEVTVELPGMNKDDIEISMEDNRLIISGERKAHRKEDERKYHRVESRFGKFSRTLPLPNIIDADNVEASYENGVLNIHIPKKKEKAGKKIEVK